MVNTILRMRTVSRETGKSRSALYGDIAQRLFTKPIRIGSRSVGWPASEVTALNSARIAGRSDAEIRALVRRLETARRTAFEGGD